MKQRITMALALVVSAIAIAALPARAGEDTFKLGVFTQMSGGAAIWGEESMNAINLALKEINAAGGFNGEKVVTILYDDQGSPEEAVKAATKLIEVDKVNACIGSVISTCVLAAGGYLNDAKIPPFGVGTSPTWMSRNWEYIFRACMNADFVMPVTASIVQDLGIKSVAVFQGQDDAAIATGVSFKKNCEALGIAVPTMESYLEGDSDFSGQIAKILNSGAEAVFMNTMGQTYGMFIKQLRLYGYDGIIFNKESLPLDSREIAGDFANHIAFAAAYLNYNAIEDCDIPVIKDFLVRYEKAYGSLPNTEGAFRTYDSMLVLWEAAKRADSNSPEAIRDAINNISDLQGLAGTLDFSAGDREGLHAFNKFILLDGKNALIGDWIASGGYDAWKKETGR